MPGEILLEGKLYNMYILKTRLIFSAFLPEYNVFTPRYNLHPTISL